jgi:hypothetical protein
MNMRICCCDLVGVDYKTLVKKKKKRLLVWSYGAIQVSRQVLARKVLGFKRSV